MTSHLRTLSARLITRWLRCPRALVVRAWAWLASHAGSPDEKRRCLEAILDLEPGNEPASAALQRMCATDPIYGSSPERLEGEQQ